MIRLNIYNPKNDPTPPSVTKTVNKNKNKLTYKWNLCIRNYILSLL